LWSLTEIPSLVSALSPCWGCLGCAWWFICG
jgi:hypothetical protein